MTTSLTGVESSPSAITRVASVRTGVALALVISLFFAWGLTYGLLDVLNKHFQQTLGVSRMESALLQTCYFGAYFLIALPSGRFIARYGYKRGILLGLAVFGLGAWMFVPATSLNQFAPFLFALFVLASGAACLETAANPYVTVLGAEDGGARRLNLAQAFTGLGAFAGPMIGGLFFFRHGASFAANAASVKMTYAAIGVVVFALAAVFWRIRLPEIGEGSSVPATEDAPGNIAMPAQNRVLFGALTQFFYFSAQVGIAAFFINYATEHWAGLEVHTAAFMLSSAMMSFTIGRFLSTAFMQKIAPTTLLAIYSVMSALLCLVVIISTGPVSVIALIAIFFFESIMFPTIFALAVKGPARVTKRAASYQVMALVGGAVAPLVMGKIADSVNISVAYLVPLFCFIVVFGFALSCRRSEEPRARR